MGPKKEVGHLAIKPGMVFAQFNANYVSKNRIFDTSYAYDLGKYFKIFSKISLFYPKLFIFFFFTKAHLNQVETKISFP
jgi:hypothetical protein